MGKEAEMFTKQYALKAEKTIKEKLKYLGITTNRYAGKPRGWDDHAEDRGNKMMDAFYLAGRRGMQWNTASAGTGIQIFEKIFTKIGLHGAEIWDHRKTQTSKLDKKQAKIIRTSLKMHPRTPTQWALWETNTIPSTGNSHRYGKSQGMESM